mgnify:CR=1 FL=1
MKEIKAFIRQHRIAGVLEALRESVLCDIGGAGHGCHNVTVSAVQRPLADTDPAQQHYSMDLAEAVVTEYKLELVCPDGLADMIVDVIARAAHTGQGDAGWILVSEIQRAVEIR